jgi:hypothetical protein
MCLFAYGREDVSSLNDKANTVCNLIWEFKMKERTYANKKQYPLINHKES